MGGAMTRFVRHSLLLTFALALGLGAASEPAAALSTVRVAANLNRPIYVTAPAGDNRLFGVVAVIELLALVLLPSGYVAWLRRRKAAAK